MVIAPWSEMGTGGVQLAVPGDGAGWDGALRTGVCILGAVAAALLWFSLSGLPAGGDGFDKACPGSQGVGPKKTKAAVGVE